MLDFASLPVADDAAATALRNSPSEAILENLVLTKYRPLDSSSWLLVKGWMFVKESVINARLSRDSPDRMGGPPDTRRRGSRSAKKLVYTARLTNSSSQYGTPGKSKLSREHACLRKPAVLIHYTSHLSCRYEYLLFTAYKPASLR
jgi:hypothetical protein